MPVAVTNPALSAIAGLLITDFQINDEAVNLTLSEISSVQVSNIEGQHEAAVVTTQLTKPQISRFVDKPMSFTYGSRINNNPFYGYCVAITPNQQYGSDTIVDISCVGVTWPLQNGTPKFARNITAPDMFAAIVTPYRADISAGYNLGAQVDTHSYVWPTLAQSNESDWEFLQTLANRIGYAIYNYQGVVRMVKPLRILTSTPIFASFIKGDQILDQTRTLLDWTATTQSLNLRQNIKPAFGFFDGTVAATSDVPAATSVATLPNIPGVVAVTPTPIASGNLATAPFRIRTDTPIKDRGMAETYSQAWLDRIDFWNEQAEARINGNARVVPGTNISVQVSGTPNGTNDFDGVWLVRGVKHVLTHNSFQTQMDLARDSTVTPVNASSSWFWNVPRGSPKVLRDPATNKWKSSWGAAPEFIQNTLT